jgi:hypothetical protein
MGLDTNKGLLKHNAEQYAKKRNVDPALIDFESIIDTELSDGENWRKIDNQVKKHMDPDAKLDEETPHKDEIAAKEREIQEKYIEEIEKDKKLDLHKQFKDDMHEEVQSFYSMFNYYLKSICRGHHTSFMVNADPGIGKSYQTTQTLINEVGEDKFTKSPAVASPFQFYKQLWELEESQQDILVLDDIEGLLRSKKALAILKQATWTETEDRFVGWNSSPSKLQTKNGKDIPKEFKFTGKLIMIFNEVPEDDIIFESLRDRCFYYELSFDYEQKCQLLRALADKGMGYDVDQADREEIASWLIDVSNPATSDLNLRTFELALKHFKGARDIQDIDVTWRDVIRTNMDIDRKLEAAREVIKDPSLTSPGERQDEFKSMTGLSKRTYRNAREELRENSQEIREILDQ